MASDTPNGMQAWDDAAQLAWQYGKPQGWESNAGGCRLTPAGYKDPSVDPAGFLTWRAARSTTNTTSSPH